MSSVPKNIARVAAVLAFCATVTFALATDAAPPVPAMIRGGLCALGIGLVVGVGLRIGIRVVREAVAQHGKAPEREGSNQQTSEKP